MKVLVINSGSSSLKYQLIETKTKKVLGKGAFERIGEEGTFYSHKAGTQSIKEDIDCSDHAGAFKKVLELIVDPTYGAVKSLQEIQAVGHRVVHGGEVFKQSTVATDEALQKVDGLSNLAPLHNPPNLLGIRACMKVLPGVPNVMVFDTAFHSTMPKHAFLYGLPISDYTQHKIRRYGFHGTSHNFVAKEAARMAGKPVEELRIITCHIGNGCSIAAIEHGKSVETSMGLTPLEGLIMGSRSGDVDPAVVKFLCGIHKLSVDECIDYLNKKCGLTGLSGGLSSDMRDLMAVASTNEHAKTALDCFNHRITKYIGSYIAVMGGVDIIVWTGGIGNNDNLTRRSVMSHFDYIGAYIDDTKNNLMDGGDEYRNTTMDITAKGAPVKTFVINTNEELEIAMETEKIITRN